MHPQSKFNWNYNYYYWWWYPLVVQPMIWLVRVLSGPWTVQSVSCPVRDLSSPRFGNPWVGISVRCPVTTGLRDICSKILHADAMHRTYGTKLVKYKIWERHWNDEGGEHPECQTGLGFRLRLRVVRVKPLEHSVPYPITWTLNNIFI